MNTTENESQSEIQGKRKAQIRPTSKNTSGKSESGDTAKDGSQKQDFKQSQTGQQGPQDNQSAGQENQTFPQQGQLPSEVHAEVQATWVTEISRNASDLDQSVRSFLTRRPVECVVAAIGLGFLGSLIVKKFNSQQRKHS